MKIFLSILGCSLFLIAGSALFFPVDENEILKFIKNNPDRSAISLDRNDELLIEHNSNKMMPLASTVKIIVAIEYALQCSNGWIDAEEAIEISDLNKFYIPNTDGGAHPAWLKSVANKIENNKISLREIAKGMIRFSSNANTEWLCAKLGLENINQCLVTLGIKNHSEMYYIASAIFVGKEAFPDKNGKELAAALRNLSIEDYIKITNTIHEKLLSEPAYKNVIGDLGMDVQRVWSDNLPGATTSEYLSVLKKINSRNYFNKKTHAYLNEVLEFVMENPKNQEWLKHSGMKGGSTAFVLTKAIYATDKKGNKTELAYFFNDLFFLEMALLQRNMNAFEKMILKDEAFRNKVIDQIMN